MLIPIYILLRIFMIPFVAVSIPSYSDFLKSKHHIQDAWLLLAYCLLYAFMLIFFSWYVSLTITAFIYIASLIRHVLIIGSIFIIGIGYSQTIEIRQTSTTMSKNAIIEIHKVDGTVEKTAFKTLPQALASFDDFELIQSYSGFIGNEQIIAWVIRKRKTE